MQAHPLLPYSAIAHSAFSTCGDWKKSRDYAGHELVTVGGKEERDAHQSENMIDYLAGELKANTFDEDKAISGRCVD